MTKTTAIVLFAALVGCAPRSAETPDSDTPAEVASAPADPAVPPAKPVQPIPEGWFALTPQLVVSDVAAVVEFYERAFGAERLLVLADPNGGSPFHGEVKIGNSIVLLDREREETRSPLSLGGTPFTFLLYVPNADQVFEAAIAAGGKPLQPVTLQFWGDRYGEIVDPSGHRWGIATHVEDLDGEQTRRRAELFQADLAAAQAAAEAKAKKKPGKGKTKDKPEPAAAVPSEPSWTQVVGTPAKSAIAEGYASVTIGVTVSDATAALAFYTVAFGAIEQGRLPGGDGKLMHAEVRIGDTVLMFWDEMPGDPTSTSASKLGGSPALIHHYVVDTDGTFKKAIDAGARPIVAPRDMFWGDRYAAVVDVVGVPWGIGTHIEDVSPQEIEQRSKQALSPGQQ